MDVLDARHAELRIRHARLARWLRAFAASGHLDAAITIFATADRVFADACEVHEQRQRRDAR